MRQLGRMEYSLEVTELRGADGKVTGYTGGPPWAPMWASTPVAALKAYMSNWVSDARRNAEQQGVNIDGDVFSTDLASQVKFVGALMYASLNRGYVCKWQTANRGFVTLDAAAISVVAACIMGYIESCFTWEASMLAAIDAAATVPALQAIKLSEGVPTGVLPAAVVAALRSSGGAFGASGGTVEAKKFKGSSAAPTASPGKGAGTTGTVTVTGSDAAGQLKVVTGGIMTGAADTVIATVTFSAPYSTAPYVVVSAANTAAGALACTPYVSATPTGFSLLVSGMSGLTALLNMQTGVSSTTYAFNYVVVS